MNKKKVSKWKALFPIIALAGIILYFIPIFLDGTRFATLLRYGDWLYDVIDITTVAPYVLGIISLVIFLFYENVLLQCCFLGIYVFLGGLLTIVSIEMMPMFAINYCAPHVVLLILHSIVIIRNVKKKPKEKSGVSPKDRKWIFYIAWIFMIIGGIGLGIESATEGFDSVLMELIMIYAVIILAVMWNVIIHELGHVLGGLLSGYSLYGFRIYSWMWMKEKDKIRLKRMSLPGTAGQCFMTPPAGEDYPVVLYHMGGVFMNLVSGILCFIAGCFSKNMLVSEGLQIFGIMGLVLAVTNGIPMRTKLITNDGQNMICLKNSREARKAFALQYRVNRLLMEGKRLREMPEEWFIFPSNQEMKNYIVSINAVLVCNRFMDLGQFEGAEQLIRQLLEMDTNLPGIYRKSLTCDLIYLELILHNRKEVLRELYAGKQKKFMRQMKKSLSVLRTQYAYAVIAENDSIKAEKLNAKFLKALKSYPYPGDAKMEKELMEMAERNTYGDTNLKLDTEFEDTTFR